MFGSFSRNEEKQCSDIDILVKFNRNMGYFEFIKEHVSKPVIAYIAGKSAPEGKRMGHAGAIISGDFGTAQGKIEALKNAGALIADLPWDVPKLLES